jgi:hypothetical protein
LVHLFSCSRIGRPIVGIYTSLLETWIKELGLWSRSSFSGNISFQFLLLWLCSAGSYCSINQQVRWIRAWSPFMHCNTQKRMTLPLKGGGGRLGCTWALVA